MTSAVGGWNKDLIETMASAAFGRRHSFCTWSDLPTYEKVKLRREMRANLNVLTSLGWQVLPPPTAASAPSCRASTSASPPTDPAPPSELGTAG